MIQIFAALSAIVVLLTVCGWLGPMSFERLMSRFIKERVFVEIPKGCAFVVHPADDLPQNIWNQGSAGGKKVEMKVTPFHTPSDSRIADLTPGDYPEYGYTVRIRSHRMWIIGNDRLDPDDQMVCP